MLYSPQRMMQVDKRDDKKRVKAATQVGVGWVVWLWGFLQGPCKKRHCYYSTQLRSLECDQ